MPSPATNVRSVETRRSDGVEHGVEPVAREVHQHLLDVDTIEARLGQVVGELQLDAGRAASRLRRQQSDDTAYQIVRVGRLAQRILLAHRRAQAALAYAGARPTLRSAR